MQCAGPITRAVRQSICTGPAQMTNVTLAVVFRWLCGGHGALIVQNSTSAIGEKLERFFSKTISLCLDLIYIYVLIAFGHFLEQKLQLLRAIEYLQSKGIKT